MFLFSRTRRALGDDAGLEVVKYLISGNSG
jgi:hypothetical protein